MYIKLLPFILLFLFSVQPAEAVVQLPSEVETEVVADRTLTKKELRQQRRLERRMERMEKFNWNSLAGIGLALGILWFVFLALAFSSSSMLFLVLYLVSMWGGLLLSIIALSSGDRLSKTGKWLAIIGMILSLVGVVSFLVLS